MRGGRVAPCQVFVALGVPHLATQPMREHRRVAAPVRAHDAFALVLPHRFRVHLARRAGGGRLGNHGLHRDGAGRAAAEGPDEGEEEEEEEEEEVRRDASEGATACRGRRALCLLQLLRTRPSRRRPRPENARCRWARKHGCELRHARAVLARVQRGLSHSSSGAAARRPRWSATNM